jgi:hypothetical protein
MVHPRQSQEAQQLMRGAEAAQATTTPAHLAAQAGAGMAAQMQGLLVTELQTLAVAAVALAWMRVAFQGHRAVAALAWSFSNIPIRLPFPTQAAG